jgi:hypothetical protein
MELFFVEHIFSSPIETREQQELAELTRYYYQNTPYKLVEQ